MSARSHPSRPIGWLLLVGFVTAPQVAASQSLPFRLPLDRYPIDDRCLAWGGSNPNYTRCGLPGVHAADDACASNDTQVFAVADGRVRYAAEVGSCFERDWGWVVVVEHGLENNQRVCSVYGHCRPDEGIAAGTDVRFGQRLAVIDNPCIPHIHFAVYAGAFAAPEGQYPAWLTGYLPNGITCENESSPWPGGYVDPVRFVLDRVAVGAVGWAHVKTLYRDAAPP